MKAFPHEISSPNTFSVLQTQGSHIHIMLDIGSRITLLIFCYSIQELFLQHIIVTIRPPTFMNPQRKRKIIVIHF